MFSHSLKTLTTQESNIVRIAKLVGASILLMSLAGSASVYAQETRPEQKEAPEPKPETTAPAGRSPEEMKAPKQEEAKPGKQEEGNRNEGTAARQDEMKQDKAKQEKADKARVDDRKSPKQTDRNTKTVTQANATGNHGRIPDDKFRAHFGRQHTFSVHTTTVGGRPRFQYGGYNFNIVEVWPADWAYTDDCYVDYIDGEYFLFDLRHPGVRLALEVVL
jgi:hypothetical protein